MRQLSLTREKNGQKVQEGSRIRQSTSKESREIQVVKSETDIQVHSRAQSNLQGIQEVG
jgi:hypothetical protein